MSLDERFVAECIRNDFHLEVAFAFTRAGVPDMQVALVFNLQRAGAERVFERFPNARDALGIHGNTCLKGLTVTFALDARVDIRVNIGPGLCLVEVVKFGNDQAACEPRSVPGQCRLWPGEVLQ